MLLWRTFHRRQFSPCGQIRKDKYYTMLLLFGIIPVFVHIKNVAVDDYKKR